jgi:hypothetical protein
MMLEVTRQVVSDLWPLYRSGEASVDSRALVDAFLGADRPFASTLQASEGVDGAMPAFRLSPDAERRFLDAARQRARMKLLVIGGTIALVGFIAIVALVGVMFFLSRGL